MGATVIDRRSLLKLFAAGSVVMPAVTAAPALPTEPLCRALPIGDVMAFMTKPPGYFDEDPRRELLRIRAHLEPVRACRSLGAKLEYIIDRLFWADIYEYSVPIDNRPLPAGDIRILLEQLHDELATAWVVCPALINLEHVIDTLNRSEIKEPGR